MNGRVPSTSFSATQGGSKSSGFIALSGTFSVGPASVDSASPGKNSPNNPTAPMRHTMIMIAPVAIGLSSKNFGSFSLNTLSS